MSLFLFDSFQRIGHQNSPLFLFPGFEECQGILGRFSRSLNNSNSLTEYAKFSCTVLSGTYTCMCVQHGVGLLYEVINWSDPLGEFGKTK